MIAIINMIIVAIAVVLGAILDLLPTSPFQQFDFSGWSEYLGYIAFFFPVREFLIFMQVLLGAVLLWYAYRWVLRFIRAVA